MGSTLYSNLGYEFKNESFIILALSHRSHGKQNNERLEFLGDSILNFVVAEALYDKFPDAVEGQLSRIRANIVNGDILAVVAGQLQLSDHLLLGVGEKRSGGHQRPSILADSVEAIIAAIYQDSDFFTAKDRILAWFKEFIDDACLNKMNKDPKSALQELLQAQSLPLPEYTLVETTGKEHEQTFHVSCKVALLPDALVATGLNRRRAEQASAQMVLDEVKKTHE